MKPNQADLLDRMDAFVFDEAGAALTFSTRLARENRWSLDYANRVLCEYKRFALLAVTAGHPVTPSDQVDQAWHLHLVYTESYWRDFCGGVLGQPLHHRPTRGGPSLGRKYLADYERTLHTYRAFFGEAPPVDIWPDSERRFGLDLSYARINTAEHWVLPKPRWWPRHARPSYYRALALTPLILWLVLAGCSSPRNPYDWRGPDFLALFMFVWFATIGIAAATRYALKRWDSGEYRSPLDLDAYDIAYLAGGTSSVIYAAIGSLAARGVIRVDATARLRVHGPFPTLAPRVERSLYGVVARTPESTRTVVAPARSAVESAVFEIEEKLESLGLVSNRGSWLPFLIVMAAPAFGVVKIFVGLSRDRPVGFLTISCIFAALLAWGLFRPSTYVTRRGHIALDALRQRHAKLQKGVDSTRSSDPQALPLAVGLFGLTVLPLSGLAELELALRAPPSDGGGGGGCGGGGGGGCGGCGG